MTSTTLHILYTGGTIGMVASEQGLLPSSQYLQQAVSSHLHNHLPKLELHWHSLQPLQDSSQTSMTDWAKLAADILRLSQAGDPVLILHGTDTMAYASSVVAMMLPSVHPPIVFTGSQQPWLFAQSDAPDNVLFAAQCALHSKANTVYLAFNQTCYFGSHVTKYDAVNRSGFIAPHGIQRLEHHSSKHSKDLLQWHPKQIEVITCLPGSTYESLSAMLHNQPDILIVKTLGNGNIPNVAAFEAAFNDNHKPLLVNHSQCLIAAPSSQHYAVNQCVSGWPWLEAKTLTFEALLGKLYLLPHTKLNQHDANQFLQTPIDHECPRAGMPT